MCVLQPRGWKSLLLGKKLGFYGIVIAKKVHE